MPSGAIPYPFGDCRVCGDHATGVHYGVATCEGCKGFYKRSLAKAYKYRCFHGGKCTISPLERNRCKSCRYQRCVMVGMSVDGVKMGRIPKVDKERALEEHYGCGSREILSSGLVVPHSNKRPNRDSKDSNKSSGARNAGAVQLDGASYALDLQRSSAMENFGRNSEGSLNNSRHGIRLRDEDTSNDSMVPYSPLGRSGRQNGSSPYARASDSRLSYGEARSRNPSERSYSRSCQSSNDVSNQSPIPCYPETLANMPVDLPIALRFAGELKNLRIDEQIEERFMNPDMLRFGGPLDGEASQGWRLNNVRHGSYDDDVIRLNNEAYNNGRDSPTLPHARDSEAFSPGRRKPLEERYCDRQGNNEPGFSSERLSFSPPIIKGLISQVMDPGKESRQYRSNLAEQFVTNSCSHPPSVNPVEPSLSKSYVHSTSSHDERHNGSARYTNHFRDNIDSEMDYLEGNDGMRSRDFPSRVVEHRIWKGRISRDTPDDNGEVSQRRSHSTFCEDETESKKEQEINDSVNYEPLHMASDMESGGYSMDWHQSDGKKRYELEHLMVEAGQRGKLRDAIDKICEDMAFGDVPIMNLDTNAITVNGEQPLDFRTKPFQAQKRPFDDGIRIYEVNDDACVSSDTKIELKEDRDSDLTVAEEMEVKTDESRTRSNGSNSFQDDGASSIVGEACSSPTGSPRHKIPPPDLHDENSLSGPMNSCSIANEPAMKRRLVNSPVKSIHIDGSKNKAKFFMQQGYIGSSGRPASPVSRNDFKVSDNGGCMMVVMRRSSDQSDITDGEDAEAVRKSRLMNRVLRCLKTFADKLMNLIEIEIGIAADEAEGRRPLHKLNNPNDEITMDDVCVFWNDFMLTLPRGNSVIMGLCANIPGFKQLNVGDQLVLIEQAYYMLWMILYSRLFWDGECHIRINCEAVYSRSWYSKFFPVALVDDMFSFVEELNRCELTPIELIILCALQLTNVDRAKLENPERVRRLHNYYLDLLASEIEKSHAANHSKVLIKIFQLLPLLAPMNQQQLEVVDTFSVDRPPTI